MDGVRSVGSGLGGYGNADADLRRDDAGVDAPPVVGTDERRMQVRAYNFWASLLGERAYPAVDDLDLDNLDDFGPNAVLLDFTSGVENPAIGFVGDKLRVECALEDDVHYIDQIPGRSLLSRLTDHYLQIIANRAPIGFEAEFVNDRGINIMYRGILLPFSSDDDTIDFIMGVINWKEAAPQSEAEELQLQVEQALRHAPAPTALAPVWADGPVAELPEINDNPGSFYHDDAIDVPDDGAALADWLALARDTAARATDADGRSRSALYDAVSRAYDFALAAVDQPADFAELLGDAGLKTQDRAPMTPVVKLVFGANYDKTRITEYACVLGHARDAGLGRGSLKAYLDGYQGGLKALVKDERARKRPAAASPVDARLVAAREALRTSVPLGFVEFDDGGDSEFVIMIGRRVGEGQVALVGSVPHDDATLGRTLKSARPA